MILRCSKIFLFLLSASFTATAQTNQAALRNQLSRIEPDSLMLEQYLSRAADMGGDDISSVKLICNWAYDKSVEQNNITVQAHALYGLGRIYLITDDYDQAARYLNPALVLATQHKLYTTQASCYMALGNIYAANKQYAEAKKKYILSIDTYLLGGDTANVASSCFNLASLIAESRADSNYFAESTYYLNFALSVITENSNPDVYINALGLKAYMFSNAGLFDSVNYFLSEAKRVIEERNYDEYRPQIFLYGGVHYVNIKQYDKAIDYFEEGLTLAREMNMPFWEYNFYDGLSMAFAAKGDYEKALFFCKRNKEVYDSVINEANFSKVVDLRHLYENEIREREMSEAKKARTISDLRLDSETRKKNNLILLLAGMVLVAILFLFLIVRLRNNVRERRRAYSKLEEKNIEIQNQSEKLVKQSREIARYQSQMNPHFVFNALNSIQGHVMNDEKQKTVTQLQNFSRLMRQTLNNSDSELISLSTEFAFLKLYFSFEKERFEKEILFEISSDCNHENVLVPPMIIQPFIENSLKHAGLDDVESPCIRLLVQEQGELLVISVSDNGSGLKMDSSLRSDKPHATEIVHSRIRLLFEDKKIAPPEQLIVMGSADDAATGTKLRLYLPLITRF